MHTPRRWFTLALLALFLGLALPARPALAATLTVTSRGDEPDASPGDGTCQTSIGTCTLRAAIGEANALTGDDTIGFALPAGEMNPAGYWTIQPATLLPTIGSASSGALTIDGPLASAAPATSWPHPRIVIDGGGLRGNGLVIASSGNVVRRLTIQNFTSVVTSLIIGVGIFITSDTNPANDNRVEGCYLGVSADGTSEVNNGTQGIVVFGSRNIIGGSNPAQRNVIAGNGGPSNSSANIYIYSEFNKNADDNVVRGNYIGTNASGTAAIGGGNPGAGILVDSNVGGGQVNNLVIDGNLISGHTNVTLGSAIIILGRSAPNQPTATRITGNAIGTQAGGVGPAIPNTNAIYLNSAKDTTIGGTTAAARNIISGNVAAVVGNGAIRLDDGVRLAIGTVIEGNAIGIASDGAPLGNTGSGIEVFKTTGAIIRNNDIAANTYAGIYVTTNQTVQILNNRIGTNSAGTSAGPAPDYRNGRVGIRIENGSGSTIQGNTIAVSIGELAAIRIEPASGKTTGGHTIQDNQIGMTAAGGELAPIPNDSIGVKLVNSANNIVAGNTIGGASTGVLSQNASNTIRSNAIGIGSSATPGVGKFGIWLIGSNSVIGGAGAGEGNTIFSAGQTGIFVDGSGSSGSQLRGNAVRNTRSGQIGGGNGIQVNVATGVVIDRTATSGNALAGIVLTTGGNATMPPPTLASFNSAGPSISATVDSTRCASGCTVQIFTGAASDDGEGPRFLTELAGVTSTSTIAVPGCDRYLSATVRDSSGNTSPFSSPMLDTTTGCASASITLSAPVRVAPGFTGAGAVPAGSTVIYEYTVTAVGGLPVNVALSASSTQGWAAAPTPSSLNVAVGSPQTFRVTVTVPPGAVGGTADLLTVQATPAGGTMQQQQVTTTVFQTFGVTIDGPLSATYLIGATSVTFLHTITNTGNGNDTINLTATATPSSNVTVSFAPSASCALAPGATCQRTMRLTFTGTPAAGYSVAVTATSAGDATSSQTVTDQAIGQAAIPGLTPPGELTLDVLPGARATFVRTLTNIGTKDGVFLPRLSALPAAGQGTAALQPTGQFSLVQNATRQLTVTIDIPDLPTAPLSGTLVRATLTVTTTDGTSVSADSVARVRLKPALTFVAGAVSPGASILPSQTQMLSYTLTNTGNGRDTFAILVTPGSELTAAPLANLTLERNESRVVVVRLTANPGAPAGPRTTAIVARSLTSPNPSVSDSVNTTIIGAAVPRLTPLNLSGLPNEVLNVTQLITNDGNLTGGFTLTASAPSGWSVTATPSGGCGSVAPGSSCAVQLTITIGPPTQAIVGIYQIALSAASSSAPFATAAANDVVTVRPAPAFLFTRSEAASVGPDTTLSFTHQLTNTGNVTDTYALTASAPSGWLATLPSALTLAPGATRTVTVTVTTPPSIAPGVSQVNVTAISQVNNALTASVTETVTIIVADRARLTPPAQTISVFPSDTDPDSATFLLTLLNTGNTTISYTLGLDSAALGGWTGSVVPTRTVVLAPRATIAVTATIAAPAGSTDLRVVPLRVRAGGGGPVLATATLTATAETKLSDLIVPPINSQNAIPGATLTYTHTLTNVRNVPDTYVLQGVAPLGWDTLVVPSSVFLQPRETREVRVTITVPANVAAGTIDETGVVVQSTTSPAVTATARERTTVLQVAGVRISPRYSRATTAGTTLTLPPQTLSNLGNAFDTFDLTVTSEHGWRVSVSPTSKVMDPFSSVQSVVVTIVVPASATLGTTDQVTLTAVSRFDQSKRSSVVHQISLPNGPNALAQTNLIALPLVGS